MGREILVGQPFDRAALSERMTLIQAPNPITGKDAIQADKNAIDAEYVHIVTGVTAGVEIIAHVPLDEETVAAIAAPYI